MCLCLGLCVLLMIASCAARAQEPRFTAGQEGGTLASAVQTETSGMVASRKHPGVLWLHNDSGDTARLFAVNPQGRLLATCTVTGARARDWEDIARGPGPDPNQDYLYIGDIGDNFGRYPSVTVYRIPEPPVSLDAPGQTIASAPARALSFTYPDGPRDAETLFVDPATKDLYIVSKRDLLSRLYRAAYPQSETRTTPLERVGLLPVGFAVGGDISPDGRLILIRTMVSALLFIRTPGQSIAEAFKNKPITLSIRQEPQGEAIAFDPLGKGFYTVSEGKHPPIYYYGRREKQDTRDKNQEPRDEN